MNKLKHVSAGKLLTLVMVFVLLGFAFLSLRGGTLDFIALGMGAATALTCLVQYLLMRWNSRHFDRYMLLIVDMLFCVGMLMHYRLDGQVALTQLKWFLAGNFAMFVGVFLARKTNILKKLNIPIMFLSIAMLVALLFVGKEAGGAKNWLIIGGMSLQPSEFVKVAIALVLARCFYDPETSRDVLIAAIFCVLCVLLLVMERDLGAGMLCAGTFLFVFFCATGNVKLTLLGIAGAGVGAAASYLVFDHVRARVQIWLDPWATYYTSGFQIAQGLMAIASGGLFGMGLNQGLPKLIPAYHTDYIFAVICEEMGVLFGIVLIALYLVFVVRGALIALGTEDRYHMILAFSLTTLITLQSFIIIGGVIKLIPLTGITLPFVSYGGSSLTASMLMLGMLQGLAIQNGEKLEREIQEL